MFDPQLVALFGTWASLANADHPGQALRVSILRPTLGPVLCLLSHLGCDERPQALTTSDSISSHCLPWWELPSETPAGVLSRAMEKSNPDGDMERGGQTGS